MGNLTVNADEKSTKTCRNERHRNMSEQKGKGNTRKNNKTT